MVAGIGWAVLVAVGGILENPALLLCLGGCDVRGVGLTVTMPPANQEFLRRYILATAETIREDSRRTLERLMHSDNLLTWMVGLSAGALLGVGPALSVIVDFGQLGRATVLALLAPFAIAATLGVLTRFALAALMTSDQQIDARRCGELQGLLLGPPTEAVAARARAVIDETTPELSEAARVRSVYVGLSRWGTGLMFLSFLAGVCTVAWVAVTRH